MRGRKKKKQKRSYINIRIDEEKKEEFRKIAKELDLDMSSLIKMFINKIIREKKIPFDLLR